MSLSKSFSKQFSLVLPRLVHGKKRITQVSHLINGNYLKRASPKAANIHNRWWRERSERNLRFHSKTIKRPRRGRTQASCAFTPHVRPLRGRFSIIHGTAGFAAFGSSTSGYGYSPPSATLWQATKSSAATLSRDDNQLKMCLLCTCESSVILILQR